MKKLILILLFSTTVLSTYGQDEVYTIVEEMPIYVGCEKEQDLQKRQSCSSETMIRFIADSVRYPKAAVDEGISGVVFINFIINEVGDIEDAKIVRGIENGKTLEDESIRVVNSFPKFIPGRQRGTEVKVQYTVPIRFKLDGGGKKRRKRRKS